jgi:hypothetical protein
MKACNGPHREHRGGSPWPSDAHHRALRAYQGALEAQYDVLEAKHGAREDHGGSP